MDNGAGVALDTMLGVTARGLDRVGESFNAVEEQVVFHAGSTDAGPEY
jgi:hypothetical protein